MMHMSFSAGSVWDRVIRPSNAGLLVIAGTLLLTLAFWQLAPGWTRDGLGTDFRGFYDPVARNIVAGKGITRADGQLATTYPPGHPLLLATVYGLSAAIGISEAFLIVIFSLACVIISTMMVYLIGRNVWGVSGGLISAAAWAVYPFMLQLSATALDGRPLSEVTFIPVFFSAIYLCWMIARSEQPSHRLFLLLGVILGVASLIRPIAFASVFIVVLFLGWSLRHLRSASLLTRLGLLLLMYVLTLLPWELKMYRETDSFILLSTVGRGNAVSGLVVFAITEEGHYRQVVAVPDDVYQLMERYLERKDQLATVGGLLTVLSEEALINPIATVKLFLIKAARSWYGTDSGRNETMVLLIQLAYLIPSIVGAIFAVRSNQKARSLVFLIGLTILYFWAMNTAVLPVMRYIMPVMGLLTLFYPPLLYQLFPRLAPHN